VGAGDLPEQGDVTSAYPARVPGSVVSARTPITVAVQLLAIEPVLVGTDDLLRDVIRRAGASPSTRVLGVVDTVGVLVGVVTALDLVAAIVGRLVPGALLTEIHDAEGMQEYGRSVEARVAGDLMRPPAALRETATLAEAFQLLHSRGLSGVYVVDATGRPTGYLDALELAAAVVADG
jgi:CBS domain-containing protein